MALIQLLILLLLGALNNRDQQARVSLNERDGRRDAASVNDDEDDEAQWAEWSSLSDEQLYRRLAERAARRANKTAAANNKQQASGVSFSYGFTTILQVDMNKQTIPVPGKGYS